MSRGSTPIHAQTVLKGDGEALQGDREALMGYLEALNEVLLHTIL